MKLSTIQEAEYRQKVVGAQESARDFATIEKGARGAADGQTVLAKSTDLVEKSVTRLGSKIQSEVRKFETPLEKATRDFERFNTLVEMGRKNPNVLIDDRTLAALETARQRVHNLSGGLNDNAASAGLARHELINLGRQAQDIAVSLAGGQSPMTVLAQQGSQVFDVLSTHKGGVGGALKSLGENLMGLVTPGRIAIGGLVAGFAGLEYGISKAQGALRDLGGAQEASGMGASRILSARTVGAGAGVDSEGMQGALERANKQFEQFKMNSGEVRGALEKIDGSFVLLGERAKTTGEFIDFVGERIRNLGREEGMDLSKKLFGEDAGGKLYESLRNAELSMDALDRAAQKVGVSFVDGPAKAALDFQREIDKAAEIADQKLLAAFGRLSSPLQEVSSLWQDIKIGIADSVLAAQRFYNVIRDGGKMGPMAGASGESLADYEARLGLNGRPLPQWNPAVSSSGLPLGWNATSRAFTAWNNEGLGPMEHTSRRGGGGRSSHIGGKSDAEKELETYQKISKELDDQIRLTESEGEAHKLVQAEIDKQNWLLKLGTNATREHIDAVSAMADRLNAAKEAQDLTNQRQKEMAEYTDLAKSSFVDLGTSLANAFQRGEQASITLLSVLDRLKERLLDKALTAAADALFGGVVGGKASTGLIGKLFGFSEGGVMTSRGPIPLRTYASGGVANSPQLALFGEGRTPEAYVPVPSGKIPVEMRGQQQAGAKVTINNYAGAQVQADQGPNGELIIAIRKMTEDMIKSQVPGVLANYNRRSQ